MEIDLEEPVDARLSEIGGDRTEPRRGLAEPALVEVLDGVSRTGERLPDPLRLGSRGQRLGESCGRLGTGDGRSQVGDEHLAVDELGDVLACFIEVDLVVDQRGRERGERRTANGPFERCREELVLLDRDPVVAEDLTVVGRLGHAQPATGSVQARVGDPPEARTHRRIGLDLAHELREVFEVQTGVADRGLGSPELESGVVTADGSDRAAGEQAERCAPRRHPRDVREQRPRRLRSVRIVTANPSVEPFFEAR